MDSQMYANANSSVAFVAPAPVYATAVDTVEAGLLEGAELSHQSTSATSMTASIKAPSDLSTEPRSILKKRTAKPATRNSNHSRGFSLFWCRRRLPAVPALCSRRHGKRVTFRASVEVTEYSKAIGHDSVPGDGTDLAVGLGRPTWNGLAHLSFARRAKRVDECAYLTIEQRAQQLKESMGHTRYQKAVTRHCRETAQVMQWRKEAVEDSKEPPQLMPTSYREARDRALKVAAEARAAAAHSDLLLLPSSARVSFAAGVLVGAPPEISPRCQKVRSKIPPLAMAASLKSGQIPAKYSPRFTAYKRKYAFNRASSLLAKKAARLKVEP